MMIKYDNRLLIAMAMVSLLFMGACQNSKSGGEETTDTTKVDSTIVKEPTFLSKPLISEIYTADPSAHLFNGKIYIYPSHDIEAGIPQNDNGDHFDMKDYHILSMDSIGGPVTDHGVALDIKDVPWAGRQMWAPDAAFANGKYYLYFPVKDKKQDAFKIGVAVSSSPTGPFKAQPEPIAGSYSIDPAVFKDDDGKYYMFFGGIWGGQMQRWESGKYVAEDTYPANDKPAIAPKVAKLSKDMLSFDGPVKNVVIQNENGQPLLAGDSVRRFFEAAWVHKHNGKYYFSYSTGNTHFIAYAIGDKVTGPYTYKGVILNPVLGWTNHHSIIDIGDKTYLFYHDTELSKGQTHLRNVKVTELKYNDDGTIQTITPYEP